MLNIDLIQEKPALQTEFFVSLPADLFSAVSLVLMAPTIEGLGQWVYATHSALTDEMRVAMVATMILGAKSSVYSGWLIDLPRDAPAHRDFAAFIGWLNSFPVEDYQHLILSFLDTLKTHCEDTEVVAAGDVGPAIIRACYGEQLAEPQVERLLQLLGDPAEFKAQLISVITRFWELFYHQEFERNLAMMDRSAAYHAEQAYGAELASVFASVTGRRFPRDVKDYDMAERVIFVPSCHIGPYALFNPCDDRGATLMIHYNGRPTGTAEPEEALAIKDLFPPLKALADETRLQILALLNGRELYAQQIVDLLDISQSAVSRHLKLMVTAGVLSVRRQESMKYYAIDERVLAALVEQLQKFHAA
jgi:DNA-binding transcriptional ArsR family regulator